MYRQLPSFPSSSSEKFRWKRLLFGAGISCTCRTFFPGINAQWSAILCVIFSPEWWLSVCIYHVKLLYCTGWNCYDHARNNIGIITGTYLRKSACHYLLLRRGEALQEIQVFLRYGSVSLRSLGQRIFILFFIVFLYSTLLINCFESG